MIISSDYQNTPQLEKENLISEENLTEVYSTAEKEKISYKKVFRKQKIIKSTHLSFSKNLTLMYLEELNLQLVADANIDLTKDFNSNEFVDENFIVPILIRCFLKHATARFAYTESKYSHNEVPKKYLMLLHNKNFICFILRDFCKQINIQWTQELDNSFFALNEDLYIKYQNYNAYHKVSKVRDWLLNNVLPFDFFEKRIAVGKSKFNLTQEYKFKDKIGLYKKILTSLRLYFLQDEIFKILAIIKSSTFGLNNAIEYYKMLYSNKDNPQYKSISKTNPQWSYYKKDESLFEFYPIFARKMICRIFQNKKAVSSKYSVQKLKKDIVDYFNSIAQNIDERTLANIDK